MSALRGFAICGVLLAAVASGACDGGHEGGHDVLLGGVGHQDGMTDPFRAACPSCHGSDLRGAAGPSCYSCHTNGDHAVLYGGIGHNAGVDCARCHGPNNRGGIGPACSNCHA